MNVRNAGYEDYGFSYGEEKELKKKIRAGHINPCTVYECALLANESISLYIIMNLLLGESFDDMNKRYYVPINKGDFYAYERLCLGLIRNRLLNIPETVEEPKQRTTPQLKGQMSIYDFL